LVAQRWSGVASTLRPLRSATFGDNCETVLKLFRLLNAPIVELQQRSKWATSTRPAVVGDIVIVHEDNIPPLCWSLGRIEAVHPGRDGKVRTVSVRTKSGVVKRSVHKLSPLPV
jgi:hypothetical protein